MQKRAMLEEIQMPPGLVVGVMNGAAFAPTLRAGEPAAAWKVQVQIEWLLLRNLLRSNYSPPLMASVGWRLSA